MHHVGSLYILTHTVSSRLKISIQQSPPSKACTVRLLLVKKTSAFLAARRFVTVFTTARRLFLSCQINYFHYSSIYAKFCKLSLSFRFSNPTRIRISVFLRTWYEPLILGKIRCSKYAVAAAAAGAGAEVGVGAGVDTGAGAGFGAAAAGADVGAGVGVDIGAGVGAVDFPDAILTPV